jgi:hypothetical protein
MFSLRQEENISAASAALLVIDVQQSARANGPCAAQ